MVGVPSSRAKRASSASQRAWGGVTDDCGNGDGGSGVTAVATVVVVVVVVVVGGGVGGVGTVAPPVASALRRPSTVDRQGLDPGPAPGTGLAPGVGLALGPA